MLIFGVDTPIATSHVQVDDVLNHLLVRGRSVPAHRMPEHSSKNRMTTSEYFATVLLQVEDLDGSVSSHQNLDCVCLSDVGNYFWYLWHLFIFPQVPNISNIAFGACDI